MVKPTKLKSITKPLLAPSQGINGEKININKYGGSILVAPVAGISSLNRSSILESQPL